SFFDDGAPVRDYFGLTIPASTPLDLGAAQRTVSTAIDEADDLVARSAVWVSPNPASGPARVHVMAAGPGPVRVTLYDVMGRTVAQVEQSVSSGAAVVPVDLTSFALS